MTPTTLLHCPQTEPVILEDANLGSEVDSVS